MVEPIHLLFLTCHCWQACGTPWPSWPSFECCTEWRGPTGLWRSAVLEQESPNRQCCRRSSGASIPLVGQSWKRDEHSCNLTIYEENIMWRLTVLLLLNKIVSFILFFRNCKWSWLPQLKFTIITYLGQACSVSSLGLHICNVPAEVFKLLDSRIESHNFLGTRALGNSI